MYVTVPSEVETELSATTRVGPDENELPEPPPTKVTRSGPPRAIDADDAEGVTLRLRPIPSVIADDVSQEGEYPTEDANPPVDATAPETGNPGVGDSTAAPGLPAAAAGRIADVGVLTE